MRCCEAKPKGDNKHLCNHGGDRLPDLFGIVTLNRHRRVPLGIELCQHHCPIAHVAAEFPQLCEAETEAFSKILGTHVQRLATIAHGDGVCTTYIPNSSRVTTKIKVSQTSRTITAGKAN